MNFALNHRVAPQLGYEAFFDLAGALGMSDVEIRNDVATSRTDLGTAARIKGWAAAGAKAIVLCSVNDTAFTPTTAERLAGLYDWCFHHGRPIHREAVCFHRLGVRACQCLLPVSILLQRAGHLVDAGTEPELSAGCQTCS